MSNKAKYIPDNKCVEPNRSNCIICPHSYWSKEHNLVCGPSNSIIHPTQAQDDNEIEETLKALESRIIREIEDLYDTKVFIRIAGFTFHIPFDAVIYNEVVASIQNYLKQTNDRPSVNECPYCDSTELTTSTHCEGCGELI